METIIDKLRKEIERLKNEMDSDNSLNLNQKVKYLFPLAGILDSLQEETPEPYTGKYDEAYLQEKITKATKSWKGVDVDKFMDEVRGRETPTDLEEEIVEYWKVMGWSKSISLGKFKVIARYFYGLGLAERTEITMAEDKETKSAATTTADRLLATPKDYMLSAKADYWNGAYEGFIAGAKWDREQVMKGAVEGRVFMSFAPGHNQMVMADVDLPTNTKVRIIVVKAEEE